jgi:GNAT superfamily N-acetyltransferase
MDTLDIPTLPTEHPVRHADGGDRGIIFVTNPERQLTGLLEKHGDGFFAEAKIPGKFNVEHWINQWTSLIRSKVGFMWLLMRDSRPVGGIGVIVSPDICDGNLVMQEAFWYVAPDHRGGTAGVRLLRAIEEFATVAGVSRIMMGRIHAADPSMRVHSLLGVFGYKPVETFYLKVLENELDS